MYFEATTTSNIWRAWVVLKRPVWRTFISGKTGTKISNWRVDWSEFTAVMAILSLHWPRCGGKKCCWGGPGSSRASPGRGAAPVPSDNLERHCRVKEASDLHRLIQDFFKQLPTNDDEQEASVQTLRVHCRTRFCSRSGTLVVAVLRGVPRYSDCFQNVSMALTRTRPQQAETLLHAKLGRLLHWEDVCTAEMQSRSDLTLQISSDFSLLSSAGSCWI